MGLAPNNDLPAGLASDLRGHFEEMVRIYQNQIYSFALRLTCNPQDAEDAAQDAFVRAFRALESYAPERIRTLALRAWLYQIVLNVVRNRKRGRHVQLVPFDSPDGERPVEPPIDEQEWPEAIIERAEQGSELSEILVTLPERYRTAVILRHVEELSYAEAALVLHQPVGTVKANVHRGVKLLRDALAVYAGGVQT